jgi:putative DNA primase/helicase
MSGALHATGHLFASRGWPVLPIAPGKKRPLISDWPRAASKDPAQIDRWLAEHPEADVGVLTGAPSGLFVVDVDGEIGAASWAGLEREHGAAPPTRTVRTARGRHYYFRLPAGTEIRNSAGNLGPGLDVRGGDGFVVAEPSEHASGGVYCLAREDDPAEPPAWLVARLAPREPVHAPSPAPGPVSETRARAYVARALELEAEMMASAAPTTRNHTLNRAAFCLGQLKDLGLDENTARADLLKAAEACGYIADDGIGAFDRTFESGWTAGTDQPRSIPEDERAGEGGAARSGRTPAGEATMIQGGDGGRNTIVALAVRINRAVISKASADVIATTLREVGLEAGQLAATGGIDGSLARATLARSAAQAADALGAETAERIVTEAYDAAFEHNASHASVATEKATTPPDEIAAPDESEIALAEELVAEHGTDRRYVSKWSRWMLFDGRLWAEEDTLEIFALSKKVAKRAAAATENTSVKKRLAANQTVAAMERLARCDRRVAATVDQWDRDAWLLNTPSGAIDLRTGEIRPARRGDYNTKITAAGPGGDAPTWRRFLGEVTGGDQELEAYLQRVTGYCLTGSTQEHALFFAFGSGGNGKGVFFESIRHVLGDYALAASMETFTESKHPRHLTELARLRGARLVTASETEEGRAWALSRIKELTGADPITANFMRQDHFTYVPQFKLLFSGNAKPTLRGFNEAERRRFNMIPFSITVPKEKRDPRLAEKLRAEAGGILGWMLEGLAEWRDRGLDPPAAVRDSTADYFESEDTLGGFLADCCEERPGLWEPTGHLFPAWRAYAEAINELVGSTKAFVQQLNSRGFKSDKFGKAGTRIIRGLRLVRRPAGGGSAE